MCDGRSCKWESAVRATLRGAKQGQRQSYPRQPAAAACGGTTTGEPERAEADETQPARLVSALKAKAEPERKQPRRTTGAKAEAAELAKTEMLLHLLLWGPS